MSETESGAARPPRWQRSQRFELSALGREAGTGYRAAIVAARVEGGRDAFDAACADWAAHRHLEPADGLYLGELQAGARTIGEIAIALEGCGPLPAEVRAVVSRLVKLQMLVPVIAPPRAPPPPRRW